MILILRQQPPSIKFLNLRMNNPFSYIIQAGRIVFASPRYIILSIASFGVFLIFYTFLLPATFTGGLIGIVSLELITPKLAIFAFLFALFLALITTFAIYAFRQKQKTQEISTAAGSFVGSVLPPLLCCSPILPTIGAFVAGIFPVTLGASGFIQGFIATYETQIFIAVVAILAYSLYQNSKQVIYATQGVCEC